MHSEAPDTPPTAGEQPAATAINTAIDPICGMTVAAVETSLHLDHDGTRYYFCGPGCLRAFSASPSAMPKVGHAHPTGVHEMPVGPAGYPES
jgi:YHS domain-containing protein